MDIRKIKKLVDLLKEADLTEIEISEKDSKVKLTRNLKNIPTFSEVNLNSNIQKESTKLAQNEQKEEKVIPVSNIIRSPMVGIFYTSPSPNAKPFVEVGQTIKSGDAVAIVEAMKIMNKIDSKYSGVISEVLVENGTAVEYNQPLIVIK